MGGSDLSEKVGQFYLTINIFPYHFRYNPSTISFRQDKIACRKSSVSLKQISCIYLILKHHPIYTTQFHQLNNPVFDNLYF